MLFVQSMLPYVPLLIPFFEKLQFLNEYNVENNFISLSARRLFFPGY